METERTVIRVKNEGHSDKRCEVVSLGEGKSSQGWGRMPLAGEDIQGGGRMSLGGGMSQGD